ncbi:paraneoplastic antigen Ma6F-like [Dipodomys spectabilis]|uniref:paraneoplastic antigen Ma6F-like n=1 Tax=Dipodomys spectabilis TaxID=105255 RepID=UPI001C534C61|nr:paraneoplastic antigen Ma6F-like [Dipodomys spectabilis]XP_042523440.1 paraneoplastic antigen Ma6F-like [Dipodomys spectabilis]
MLKEWCQSVGADTRRSLLILDIPEECQEGEFQEAVQASLQPLGSYRVLCRAFRKELGTRVALVEFAERLNRNLIPQAIAGSGALWPVAFLPHAREAEAQDSPGGALPEGHGASGGAAAGEGGAPAEAGAGAEAGLSGEEGASGEEEGAGISGAEGAEGEAGGVGAAGGAMGGAGAPGAPGAAGEARVSDEEGAGGDMGFAGVMGVVSVAGAAGEAGVPGEEGAFDAARGTDASGAWAQQWSQALQPILENMAYQELRPFSGREEPGCGEESFESWLDHANDMLYLWRYISERERRRRLVESLGGPALDLLCGLLEEHPDTPAQDCLGALVQVFGNKDTRMTARLKFLTCSQRPRETLFAYVMRLEGLLQMAMEKGAIHPAVADQVRARQVLMRARPNRVLQNNLRRLRLERRPPGFVGLLRLVRETEAWEAGLARNERAHGEVGARGQSGGLAVAQAVCAHGAAAAESAPAAEGAPQGPAGSDGARGAAVCAHGDGAAAEPDPDQTADTDDATRAAASPGTREATAREGEDATVPAGLSQAASTEAPGAPGLAQMGLACGEGPGGPGWEPQSLLRAAEQEAEESQQYHLGELEDIVENILESEEEEEDDDDEDELGQPKARCQQKRVDDEDDDDE